MKTKKNFGIFLSVSGMIGLIFILIMIINFEGNHYNLKAFAIYGLPVLLFFLSGISITSKANEKL